MGTYLINFLVHSMAMVGLLFVCLMVYKKTMVNNKCSKNKNELDIENALNLSPRKTIYIVKAGNEKFLIASDAERTTFLAKLDASGKTPAMQGYTPQMSTIEVIKPEKKEEKGIDYSEVMNAIKSTQKRQPVMKEMLRKLEHSAMQESKQGKN